MKSAADNAHIESDEVEAESERSTGDSASKARKSKMDDFMTFAPSTLSVFADEIRIMFRALSSLSIANPDSKHPSNSQSTKPARNIPTEKYTRTRGSHVPSCKCTNATRKMKMDEICCVIVLEARTSGQK